MQVARHRFRVCVKGLRVVARAVGIMDCDSSLDFFLHVIGFGFVSWLLCVVARAVGIMDCVSSLDFFFVLLNRMHVVSSSLAP